MPSYSEYGSFPPLDDRPVGKVPATSQEESTPQAEEDMPDVCARCGKENCKHKR